MKATDLIATAQTTIDAPATKVWDAFVNPDAIKKYMFGTTVVSDWKEGSSIVWKGEWEGKAYEDKGVIKQFKPDTTLQYSHFSPLTGKSDVPENYHTVTIQLSGKGESTEVVLTQDNNATEEEKAHSEKNWNTMLAGVKKLVEEGNQ